MSRPAGGHRRLALAALLASTLLASAHAQPTCSVFVVIFEGNVPFERAGGPGLAEVRASTPTCAWTAASDVPWITFPDGNTGTGTASLPFLVAAVPIGTEVDRTGRILAGGANSVGIQQRTDEVYIRLEAPTTPVVSPFVLRGWAVADAAGTGSDVDRIDVYGGENFIYRGRPIPNEPRGHAADWYGSAYLNSGFSLTETLGPGQYMYNAYPFRAGRTFPNPSSSLSLRITVVEPALTLNVSQVQMAAVRRPGNNPIVTPPQPVILRNIGAAAWTATPLQPWISVAPASGSGDGRFTVHMDAVHPSVPSAGTISGTVRVNAAGIPGGTVDLPVFLSVHQAGTTAAPFGVLETPASNASGLSGAIPITGWALDDVGVARVLVYRDPVAGEAPSSLVYLGDATTVEGARPDVAAAYPTQPSATSAGWGYMLLSNALPNQGTGTFTFYAYAVDAEGNQSLLGTSTVTLDNATSVVPFGSLDSPQQGQLVSGDLDVLGWALTPRPGAIRPDGSRMVVLIDGAEIGRPVMGLSRPDVAALFPGLYNTGLSGFRFRLDSRILSNGLHTIALIVRDSAGQAQGIGSRHFIVDNP